MSADNRLGHDGHGYATFTPRPDDEELEDQQSSFYDSLHSGVATVLGGNGSGTTTLTVAKACRFLLETPPPRVDTPFWFLASSYDQATKVLFKEKIWLGGLIPSEMFDWNRADWYKVKQTLPYAMPLKKHENGNNWMMQFLSYEQSLGQMMAQATAGFVFCEQFDWIILEEVLRGTREYNFKGNKLIEFTPVKPELSIQLEEMIENGEAPENPADRVPGAKYLPKDWGVYYCNTEASLKHGQVDREWYESFFAMIPEEMRAVRQKGRFASYEGVIYSGFSPHLHVIGDEIWRMMDGAYHRRGIDWGAGPHNPFASVWGARTPDGQWLIYDEYESANQEFTTVDHLCEVQQRWEWPRSSLFYGTSWADPARPENLRMAAKLPQYVQGREDADDYDFMVIHRARNAVQEGIEHVRYLLKPTLTLTDPNTGERVKKPRLLIHRSCKKLIRCLRTYRWKKDSYSVGAANPEHARPEPLKLNDHLCVTADTMIAMADGTEKPITEVKRGDMVVTHRGIGMVLAGGTLTGKRDVVHLQYGNRTLPLTDDHRMWNTLARDWLLPAECQHVAIPRICSLACHRRNPAVGTPDHERSLPHVWEYDVQPISRRIRQFLQPVYCLATEHGSAVFNGVSSVQCDALRYMCLSEDASLGATIETANQRRPDTGGMIPDVGSTDRFAHRKNRR
jgi:hypothetical protein